ncbi:hypothetical protein FF011L_12030 [Roseimaritima multifibrata]|uniref:Uncharacterized protein n=1 Tax=Roseimaritima multifibrata TaxID=1930274 RepID=A0A517MC39_9BACT|nr:hypothetical protein FF011L_12030 [Roseimaritima multifibrata]
MSRTPSRIVFEKQVDGRKATCEVNCFDDGSACLSGEGIDSWIFEFTDEAMERAIVKAESQGFVRVTKE